MAKRKKLKTPAAQTAKQPDSYDRRATDLPANAKIAVTYVKDPYGFPAGVQWDAKHGEWILPKQPNLEVVASLRDDPLRQLLVRDQISQLQYDGGKWYEARYEAQFFTMTGIDPTAEVVDGGIAMPILEWIATAMKDMDRARKALGIEGEMICRGIIGQGLTISQFASSRNMSTRLEVEYIGRRLRECLFTLAGLAGLMTMPHATRLGMTAA